MIFTSFWMHHHDIIGVSHRIWHQVLRRRGVMSVIDLILWRQQFIIRNTVPSRICHKINLNSKWMVVSELCLLESWINVHIICLPSFYRRISQVFFGPRRIYFCCPQHLFGRHQFVYVSRHDYCCSWRWWLKNLNFFSNFNIFAHFFLQKTKFILTKKI